MKRRNIVILILVVLLSAGVLVFGLLQGKHRAEAAKTVNEEGPVPYYAVFRELAPTIGWEWYTLAAVAWNESHFNPHATSYVGAKGIMQLMPKTARRFGLNDSTILVPEDNIRAGVEYIRFLQKKWSFITNMDEQTKFVLASYNAGPGFIFQARREVRDNGGNPYVWSNVEPYVQQAAARKYVHNVLRTAKKYEAMVSDDQSTD